MRMTTENVITTTDVTKYTTSNDTKGLNNTHLNPTSPSSTIDTTTQEIITSTTALNLKLQTVSGCFGDIVHFHCDVGILNL